MMNSQIPINTIFTDFPVFLACISFIWEMLKPITGIKLTTKKRENRPINALCISCRIEKSRMRYTHRSPTEDKRNNGKTLFWPVNLNSPFLSIGIEKVETKIL